MAAACVREPAVDSDDEPLQSGDVKLPRGRWAWNGGHPASQVLPTDSSRLTSAARALSPGGRVVPLPALPLPLPAEEPEEQADAPGTLFDGWNGVALRFAALCARGVAASPTALLAHCSPLQRSLRSCWSS